MIRIFLQNVEEDSKFKDFPPNCNFMIRKLFKELKTLVLSKI